jgi:hypothetical protein
MEHSNGKKTSTKAGTVAESLPKKGLIGGEKKFHESTELQNEGQTLKKRQVKINVHQRKE